VKDAMDRSGMQSRGDRFFSGETVRFLMYGVGLARLRRAI
jgi:hypothetical protein